jgi:hypothetical protein
VWNDINDNAFALQFLGATAGMLSGVDGANHNTSDARVE